MQSPYIGRGIALVVIIGLIGWTAFRALGARNPETPKIPFRLPPSMRRWPPRRANKRRFLREAASGRSGVFEHTKGVSSATSGLRRRLR